MEKTEKYAVTITDAVRGGQTLTHLLDGRVPVTFDRTATPSHELALNAEQVGNLEAYGFEVRPSAAKRTPNPTPSALRKAAPPAPETDQKQEG